MSRRSKRPDRQIYQPGRTRLNQKRPEGEGPDDPGGPNDQGTSFAQHAEGDQLDRSNEEGLNSQTSQSSLTGSGSDTNESGSKRRHKRPEMQRYVPKVKVENQSQHQDEKHSDPSGQGQAENITQKDTDSSQAPGSPHRKVDLNNMVITLDNEGEVNSPGRSRRGKGPELGPKKRGPRSEEGGGRGQPGHVRNVSGGSDNDSEASDDSLEWDYASVDAELASLDLGSRDELNQVQNPTTDEPQIPPQGPSQPNLSHQPGPMGGRGDRQRQQGAGKQNSDGSGRRRRNRDNRRNRNNPDQDPHRMDAGMENDEEGVPHVRGGQSNPGPLDQREEMNPPHVPQPLPQREPREAQRQRHRRGGKQQDSRQDGHGEESRMGKGFDNQRGRNRDSESSSQSYSKELHGEMNTPQAQRKQRQDRDSQQQSRKGRQDSKKAQPKDDRMDSIQPLMDAVPEIYNPQQGLNIRPKGPQDLNEGRDGRQNQRGQNRKATRQDSSGSEEQRSWGDSKEDRSKRTQNRFEEKHGRDPHQKRDGLLPNPHLHQQQSPHQQQHQHTNFQNQRKDGVQQQHSQHQQQSSHQNPRKEGVQQQHPQHQQQQHNLISQKKEVMPQHQQHPPQQQPQGRTSTRHDQGGEPGARGGDGKGGRRRDRRGRGKSETEDQPKKEPEKEPVPPLMKGEPSNWAEECGNDADMEEEQLPDEAKNTGKEGKKPSLKVTFAHNERQVKMLNNRGKPAEEPTSPVQSPHGPVPLHGRTGQGSTGGIIRLPTQPQQPTQKPTEPQHIPPSTSAGGPGLIHPPPGGSHPNWNPPQPRGRGSRGRGGSHRTLYDPNNPNKSTPAMSSSPQQLHFHDPSYDAQKPAYADPYAQGAFTATSDYYYNYQAQGFHDYGDYSSSPQQGEMHYNHQAQYFESGTYTDNAHEDPYYRRYVKVTIVFPNQ